MTGVLLLTLVLVCVVIAALGYVFVIAPVLGSIDLIGGLRR